MNVTEKSTHPTSDALAGLASDPENSRYGDVAQHVSDCPRCDRELARIHRFLSGLKQATNVFTTCGKGGDHLNAEQIENYIRGATELDREKWTHHLQSCSECMRHVMLARTRELKSEPTEVRQIPVQQNTLKPKNNTSRWMRRPIPLWTTLPSSLAAGLLFAAVISFTKSPAMLIATYQDNPQVTFSPTRHDGLGFFSSAADHVENFSGVVVTADRNEIHLNWAPIEGAASYEIKIMGSHIDDQSPVIQQTTTRPTASVARNLITPGRRYEWIISGTTASKLHFATYGGFVVSNI